MRTCGGHYGVSMHSREDVSQLTVAGEMTEWHRLCQSVYANSNTSYVLAVHLSVAFFNFPFSF